MKLDNVRRIAETGVQRISIGAPPLGTRADVALEIDLVSGGLPAGGSAA